METVSKGQNERRRSNMLFELARHVETAGLQWRPEMSRDDGGVEGHLRGS